MNKVAFAVVLALLLAPMAHAGKGDDPIGVYRAVLKKFTNKKKGDKELIIVPGLQFIEERHLGPTPLLAALRPEMVADFQKKNRTPAPFSEKEAKSLGATTIDEDRYQAFFALPEKGCEEGWKKFYQAYPASDGVIRFSAIGFSSDGRFALVYFETSHHCRAAGGGVATLVKKESAWYFLFYVNTWIS